MSDNQPNDEEQGVISKYNKFKIIDPFPEIKPALLNSADIHRYANTTGMIFPYHKKELKSASYSAKIAGECRYWDNDEQKVKTVILQEEGDQFTLHKNAIAFVGIEPTFRLPYYIALRFNLKITHVYRGLLLGTGPLIDPGFEGKITIPLHNLTSNDYVFTYGETLIWIEFTKTSELPLDSDDCKLGESDLLEKIESQNYVRFPDDKKYQPLSYYLKKALKGSTHNEIISSIPGAMKETQKTASHAAQYAEKANNTAKDLENKAKKYSLWGAVAVISAIAGILLSSWSLQRDYFEQAVTKTDLLDQSYKHEIKELEKKNAELMKLILDQNRISEVNTKNSLEKQYKQIELLENRVNNLETIPQSATNETRIDQHAK
jgi:deoxycytidine triphosphate deaminase